MTLEALQKAVIGFARERDWEQFHDAKNLSMALTSEVGELNAVLRWIRNEDLATALAEEATRNALLDEIGDIGILLLQLCARTGVNLDEAVLEKLKKNERKYPVHLARGVAEARKRP